MDITKNQSAAKRALQRAKLLSAGFVISHQTHTLGEVPDWMMTRWEIEEVQFVRMCLFNGHTKASFTELVKRHSHHPISFQYSKRVYFN